MKKNPVFYALGSVFALFLCACTTNLNETQKNLKQADWAANGYYGPLRSGDPFIIGTFTSKSVCKDAVKDWLATQVVGQEISGECLPIDRN